MSTFVLKIQRPLPLERRKHQKVQWPSRTRFQLIRPLVNDSFFTNWQLLCMVSLNAGFTRVIRLSYCLSDLHRKQQGHGQLHYFLARSRHRKKLHCCSLAERHRVSHALGRNQTWNSGVEPEVIHRFSQSVQANDGTINRNIIRFTEIFRRKRPWSVGHIFTLSTNYVNSVLRLLYRVDVVDAWWFGGT